MVKNGSPQRTQINTEETNHSNNRLSLISEFQLLLKSFVFYWLQIFTDDKKVRWTNDLLSTSGFRLLMYLNCHSYYSLRYGTLSVELLVSLAKQKNIQALALTDINNSTAVLDFVKACRNEGIHPVAGMEFRNGNELLYICIARNNYGFLEINELLTKCNFSKTPLPGSAPDFKEVFVIYPKEKKNVSDLKENEYIGIRISDLPRMIFSPLLANKEKLVVLQPVSFATNKGYELHRILRAIDNNIVLSKLEPQHLACADEIFFSPDELREKYSMFPFLIRNTEKLMEQCSFDFDFKTVKNKKIFSASTYDDRLLLEKLAIDGMKFRYGTKNREALKRVMHELEAIDKLGFSAYFLVTWDVIRYSMSRGFYHVGRGSGANSVVAYCLRITDVCPIELDLYFERFLNPKRNSPPDFDIDYSWKDRDEVIEYIFKRYGHRHTVLLGAMSTFKDSSIIRELGKVYGLPKQEIDKLAEGSHGAPYPKRSGFGKNRKDEKGIVRSGEVAGSHPAEKEINTDEITEKIYYYGKLIQNFPNLRSIHAGGILISEEPITAYTALDMPPKGFPTAQWDMYVAEDIGFEKLDILSQRGIGHIKEAAEVIRRNRGISVDVHEVQKFKTDEKVRQQLKSGDTIGCFYIESPAMRGLLKKLRCDNYLSLVAASSIIRPGVARSGMMRQYIQRFHNPDKIQYLHPVMKEQLAETYGVMVYQEDVLKVCHHFGGLDLADSDVLRRMMSGKGRYKKQYADIVAKFFSNCKERGYPEHITREVWRQIESFAGYSFSKAHSASYAVESYQSLYLKSHFPMEFMVAVINNFGGFYSTWVYVNEAKKAGAKINLPCVNKSLITTTIYGDELYLGFVHIAKLEEKAGVKILGERLTNGEYVSLEDFVCRTGISLEQLLILIRIGALRFTGKGKKNLLWEAHLLLGKSKKVLRPVGMFPLKSKKYNLPALLHSKMEDAFDEIEVLGFPVSMTFFEMLPQNIEKGISAGEIIRYKGRQVMIVGQLVTVKYVFTIRKTEMRFGTFLDGDGNFFDTTHFPASLERYPFRGSGVYIIYGRVVEEFGFPGIEVSRMEKVGMLSYEEAIGNPPLLESGRKQLQG